MSRPRMMAPAMVLAVCAWPVAAQRTGTQPGGGSNPGAGGVGSIGTRNPGTTHNNGPAYPDLMMNRGIYISGKVMLEDGSPPPDTVTIERVCGANPRAEAYTDSKGRFDFQLGQETAVMQDASETGANTPGSFSQQTTATGRGQPLSADYRMMNCDLRASLPGYRSETLSLSGRRLFDNPDVGTIVLHRMGSVEGSVISVTSLAAPNDARKAYERGGTR